MKKILLGTTGLVGAALIATAASAETPKVTLGGFSDFQAGWADNDVADEGSVGFRNDNTISVRVDGKTDAGLGYGAVIDLVADIDGENDNESTNGAKRTFTYLDGGWGRVEMGGNKSVAATMRVDASTVAVATGGINGDFNNFVDPTGGIATGTGDAFISSSKLQAEHGDTTLIGDESTYNATKISYYSPRWAGFQFGASYTPDLDARGQSANRDAGFSDVIDLGLGYETQFDGGTKLAVSGTYEIADAQGLAAGADDIEGWNLGALVGFSGFNIAGSYGEWSEGAVGGALTADGDYWTAGLGYDMGAVGLSATYLESSLDVGAGDNDFNNLVLGADYKLAPGLTPYAEVSFYEFDGTTADNDGTAVIVGTQIAF